MSVSIDVWLPALAVAVSAGLTEVAIHYGHRRAMIDQPGRRRSHTTPTPRGGGIGIVVAAWLVIVLGAPWAGAVGTRGVVVTCFALALVAAVGWWDDHRGIGRVIRLAAQMIAAVAFVVAVAIPLMELPALGMVFMFVAAIFAVVWSINLHNFMDGINGLLAFQAAFVFAGVAWHASEMNSPAPVTAWLALALAVLAFVPFNFPRARVFLGDVGSGTLGLLVAVAAFSALAPGMFFIVAILGSAFVVDATATLVLRFVNGRRWYSPHREHLYQWLARSGWSHARVVGAYALWNVLVALPCSLLYAQWHYTSMRHPLIRYSVAGSVSRAIVLVAALYVVAFVVWILGKRWCLRRVRGIAAHAPA